MRHPARPLRLRPLLELIRAELSDDPIDDNELDGSAAHGDGDGHESEDSVPAPQRRTGRVKRSLNLNMDLADDNDADDIEDDTEELRAAL